MEFITNILYYIQDITGLSMGIILIILALIAILAYKVSKSILSVLASCAMTFFIIIILRQMGIV